MSDVIAFAGAIGSGKSTVSARVAELLNRPRVSFSSAVRTVAEERDLGNDRQTLQDLGDQLISEGWDSFCERVLSQAAGKGGSPIVDGIRHVGAINALRRLASPSSVRVVFLYVPEKLRLARLSARGLTEAEIAAADSHPNESELPRVRGQADIVMANDKDVAEVANDIIKRLGIAQ